LNIHLSIHASIISLYHSFISTFIADTKYTQVAQISQRDRAAGWVSFGRKWKTIFCRQCRPICSGLPII